MATWALYGTANQRQIVLDALARCDFPFDRLKTEMKTEAGRDYIPVEWADLSRYGAVVAEAQETGGHAHIHENGDTGHPIERVVEGRARVLGLAWYSGKVTLDLSLEKNPELAAEVFLSEGAHMVDFFYMTDEHRSAVWNAYHEAHEDIPLDTDIEDGVIIGHGHGWFDVGGYNEWVGEAFMGGFVTAYSDIPVTIPFVHKTTPAVATEIRAALTPDMVIEVQPNPVPEDPGPLPEVPAEPTEEPHVDESVDEEPTVEPSVDETSDAKPYFVGKNHKIFHDNHKGVKVVHYYDTPPADSRPCKVCKPKVD